MGKPTFDIITQAIDQMDSQRRIASYIHISMPTFMDIFGYSRIPRKLKKKYRKGILVNISYINHTVELSHN